MIPLGKAKVEKDLFIDVVENVFAKLGEVTLEPTYNPISVAALAIISLLETLKLA